MFWHWHAPCLLSAEHSQLTLDVAADISLPLSWKECNQWAAVSHHPLASSSASEPRPRAHSRMDQPVTEDGEGTVIKGLPLPLRNLPWQTVSAAKPTLVWSPLCQICVQTWGSASLVLPPPAPSHGCQTHVLAKGFPCSVPLPPPLTSQSHYQLPYNPVSAPACWRTQPTQASSGGLYTLYKDSSFFLRTPLSTPTP